MTKQERIADCDVLITSMNALLEDLMDETVDIPDATERYDTAAPARNMINTLNSLKTKLQA